MNAPDKPIVLITGAAGNIGRSLAGALANRYRVVGLDKPGMTADFPLIEVDFTDHESVRAALGSFRKDHGRHIASVIHLVAFFDFTGEGQKGEGADEFDARPGTVLQAMWTGGVSLPWNLALVAAVGLWLMFTRLTLAAAEVARALRFLLIPLGAALFATPFVYAADVVQTIAGILCGILLIILSFRRGIIRERYAGWQKLIV